MDARDYNIGILNILSWDCQDKTSGEESPHKQKFSKNSVFAFDSILSLIWAGWMPLTKTWLCVESRRMTKRIDQDRRLVTAKLTFSLLCIKRATIGSLFLCLRIFPS